MGILNIAKKGIRKVKGKKASGNKGNPGTSRKKKIKKVKKPVANKNIGLIGKSAIDISKWNLPNKNITSEVYDNGGMNNGNGNREDEYIKSPAVNANQVEAIGNLTKGNGKLAAFLQNATGSTSLLDWANFFKRVPRDQQTQIIAESRTDDRVDDSPSTIQKIKQYAMDAAGIYARATGKDINTGEAEAAAAALKDKQKTNTMFIIGGIIITVLIVAAVLLRSPAKKFV